MGFEQRRRILVVEDDRATLAGIEGRLRQAGYEPVPATSASAAWRTLVAERVDLVLLDLGLPDGDGIEVLELLRSSSEVGQPPVIVLTTRAPDEAEDDALDAGAQIFVQKPADMTILLSEIARLTAGRPFAAELSAARDGAKDDVYLG